MVAILMCLSMVCYKILENKEKIKKLSVKQIIALEVLYPALTVSNLSVPKAKRQVQGTHHKLKDEKER